MTWSLSLIAKTIVTRAANNMAWPTNQPIESPKKETRSVWKGPRMVEAMSNTKLAGARIFLNHSHSWRCFYLEKRAYRLI